MSHGRVQQLRELQGIINEISRDIMWVNEREEEELMFDWGDKNIDQYIPRKQESYSVRSPLLPPAWTRSDRRYLTPFVCRTIRISVRIMLALKRQKLRLSVSLTFRSPGSA